MIKFSFHLITLSNKFTTDEEEIEYSFKSHGGRLLVLYMLITYFINNYNNVPYSFWKNFGIGIIIAIVWDIVTAGLYLLKMNYIDNKFKNEILKEDSSQIKSNKNKINNKDKIIKRYRRIKKNTINKKFFKRDSAYKKFERSKEFYINNDYVEAAYLLRDVVNICLQTPDRFYRHEVQEILNLAETILQKHKIKVDKQKNELNEEINEYIKEVEENNVISDEIIESYLTCEKTIFIPNFADNDSIYMQFKMSKMAYYDNDIGNALRLINEILDVIEKGELQIMTKDIDNLFHLSKLLRRKFRI